VRYLPPACAAGALLLPPSCTGARYMGTTMPGALLPGTALLLPAARTIGLLLAVAGAILLRPSWTGEKSFLGMYLIIFKVLI
jgi:hypothetical protein